MQDVVDLHEEAGTQMFISPIERLTAFFECTCTPPARPSSNFQSRPYAHLVSRICSSIGVSSLAAPGLCADTVFHSDKWLEVWDQNASYGNKSEEAEEEDERLEYLHQEFEWFELFFDLIFVAYVVELASLLKTSDYLETDEDKWWRGAHTAVLFASAWQTWNHINYLTTRFVIRIKFSFLVFAIVVVFVSLLSVRHLPDNEHGHPQYTDGLGQRAAIVAQVVSRLFLSYFYVVARVEISAIERR
jgi:hypothetical protein